MSDEDTLEFRVGIELYLRNREDPLIYFTTMGLPQEVYEEHGMHAVVEMAENMVLSTMDIKSEPFFMFQDERNNRGIILRDEVQAISILAPTDQTQIFGED